MRTKLSELLSRFVINSSMLFITGEFNKHIERHDDTNNVIFLSYLHWVWLNARCCSPKRKLPSMRCWEGGLWSFWLSASPPEHYSSKHTSPGGLCHVRGWRRLDMIQLIRQLIGSTIQEVFFIGSTIGSIIFYGVDYSPIGSIKPLTPHNILYPGAAIHSDKTWLLRLFAYKCQ